MGYPLIVFDQQNDTNIYTIRQERYFQAISVRFISMRSSKSRLIDLLCSWMIAWSIEGLKREKISVGLFRWIMWPTWWISGTHLSSTKPAVSIPKVHCAFKRSSQNSISILAYEVEFPADVTWFKANLNNTGFYRVNYPPHIWDGLTNQLLREHTIFSTADRAQLLNDAFSLSM